MSDRYKAAKALFLEAMAKPSGQRSDWLRVHCGDDSALLAEVQSLLAFADEPAAIQPPSEAPSIPDYRMLRRLGRGGMGQVWLAERLDPELQQQVAIKLLALDLTQDPDARARFRIERRILAQLDHPHIARLLDGGDQVDGVPYLVMEYIEGVTIDRYCRQRELAVATRVALLLKVAKALQAAHQQLIVHRDLKPANVLVDRHGEPKLLDFGIAKLLDGEAQGDLGSMTSTGMQRLTPRYAAPEQVRSETITVATDVYAFGVLAYELLSGRSPYGTQVDQPHLLPGLVCQHEPDPPSQHCADPAARRSLRGDLDAVVLRCLRKAVSERYPDLQSVVAELEAWQHAEPVLARRGERWYRVRRGLWRHRVALATTLLIVALTGVFVTQLRQQVQIAAAQAARAEAERSKADQVTDFMLALFKNADPARALGAELTVRQALDQGVTQLQTELDDQPVVKSHMLRELAAIYGELGEQTRAVTLAEEAVALIEKDRERNPRAWLEALYTRVAEVDRFARPDEDSLRRARTLVSEAVRLGERRIELRGRNRLGLEWSNRGEHVLALEQFALVEEGLRSILESSGTNDWANSPPTSKNRPELQDLAMSSHNRCRSLLAIGELGKADAACTEAAALKSQLWPANHPLQISTQMTLAEIAYERGDLETAIAMEKEVLARTRLVYGDEHVRTAYAQVNLGTSMKQAGRYAEAAAELRPALALLEQTLGQAHAAYQLTLNNYANLLGNQGDWTQALELHEQVLALRQARFGPDSAEVAQSLMNRANAEKALGRAVDALASTEHAVAIYQRQRGAEHADTLRALANLASKQLELGRHEQAASTSQDVLDVLGSWSEEDDRPAIRLHATFLQAQSLWALGDFEKALQAARQARTIAAESPSDLIPADQIEQWIQDRSGSPRS